MYKILSLFTFVILFSPLFAQNSTNESFTDSNFTAAPTWIGSTADFIINQNKQLQLNNVGASGTSVSYLATSSTAANNGFWEFYVKLDFAPSSSNFAKFYLVSDNSDINAAVNGYFVQIGGQSGTTDDVRLYRQDGVTDTLLIDGIDGTVGTNPEVKIRVTKNANSQWELFLDQTAVGNSYLTQGTSIDTTYNSSSFLGVWCRYTSTRFDKFFFDDIVVNAGSIVDTLGPVLTNLQVLSSDSLELSFNEFISPTTLGNLNNWSVNKSIGNPSAATYVGTDSSKVFLSFANNFINAENYELITKNLEDTSGNTMQPDTSNFTFVAPVINEFRDLVINELYPDPTPSNGLPNAEFIEIYNPSSKTFDLQNWTVSDATSTGTLPAQIIQPGEYVIICPSANVVDYQTYGTAITPSSFPSLNNSGDNIKLMDNTGKVIDSSNYDLNWYNDASKESGGYTLEQINPFKTLGGKINFSASVATIGGTPGAQNSIFDTLPDTTPPNLVGISVLSSTNILLEFDEPLNTTTALNSSNFTVNKGIGNPTSIQFVSNDSLRIDLQFSTAFTNGETYEIITQNVEDKEGNKIVTVNSNFLYEVGPEVTSVHATSNTRIQLNLNEKIASSTIGVLTNFTVNLGVGNPSAVTYNGVDSASLLLDFSTLLANGTTYELITKNLANKSGEIMISDTSNFTYFIPATANYRDIVINELYPDPNPSLGLPESEFVELYNSSDKIFDLSDWSLTKSTPNSNLQQQILKPGEYLIICTTAADSIYSTFGLTQGVANLPTLTNSGDEIKLFDNTGKLIDVVNYELSWYRNETKDDGGYTLEQINPLNDCIKSENFIGSNAAIGGTPGTINSVYDTTLTDNKAPEFLRATAITSSVLLLEFNEFLDTNSAKTANYIIDPFVMVDSVIALTPNYSSLQLVLNTPIDSGIIYSISVDQLNDCSVNEIEVDNLRFFALPDEADSNDIIINEILFNERTGGSDFVELYNRSEKVISLTNWAVGDTVTNQKLISNEPLIILPKGYLVLTKDKANILKEYPNSVEENIFEVEALPTLNNTEGRVIVYNEVGEIIDSVEYNEDQHFALLQDNDGVSLERISSERPSTDKSNFHSASESFGFATPGYLNSQEFANTRFGGEITIDPEIFSPNNDGFKDVVNINYQFTAPGFVANVSIFDKNGRLIKRLIKNELLGSKGTFTWDGTTEDNTKARIGIYVILVDALTVSGNKEVFKEVVVVAERLD